MSVQDLDANVPAAPQLGRDTRITVTLATIGAIAVLVAGAVAFWGKQDVRISNVEAGLKRVEKIDCLVAKKLGLEIPDCQP